MAPRGRLPSGIVEASESWLDLTDEQCGMLLEAFEETPLAVVLNTLASADDAPYWNRKHRYVDRAIRISGELIDRGLVTVWVHPKADYQGGHLLSVEEARPILADPRNWWTPEPDEDDDPTLTHEQLIRFEGREPDAEYDLMPTERAQALAGIHEDDRIPLLVKGYPPDARH